MSNNLSKHTLGLTQLQSGQGVPTHQAKLGSLYINVSNADYYKNIDGLSNWTLITGTSGGTGTDYYVTGGTYNSITNTLTLDRQNGSVVITGFTSGTSGGTGVDTYVTGFTYNGINKLTIFPKPRTT